MSKIIKLNKQKTKEKNVREYNFSNTSERKVLISLKYKGIKGLLENIIE